MRFIHDNLNPLLAALIFIAAVTCWFGISAPVPPGSAALAAETWSLPQPVEHDNKESLAAINARNLWGSAVTEAPPEPEWHVRGIAMSGAERFILLAYEGQPLTTLKVGDSLPDGAKIVQIERDRFFVLSADKKKISYGIHKHDQTK
ncbi:MAG: hypothetical protein COZ23_01445 [Hydrogenophilales bacterium CG_4_10_14_3_um_filter_58_23]|nr:MAG: hypothetical protein COZ23_01445 [Hydrogenophilales bacterium CG_4_10_14_3_um_filter_58_23]